MKKILLAIAGCFLPLFLLFAFLTSCTNTTKKPFSKEYEDASEGWELIGSKNECVLYRKTTGGRTLYWSICNVSSRGVSTSITVVAP